MASIIQNMNSNRLKYLALVQIYLGLSLLIPPSYYLLSVRTQLSNAVTAFETDSRLTTDKLTKIGDSLKTVGGTTLTVAGYAIDLGKLVDKVPMMGPVSKPILQLGGAVSSLGGALKASGETISSGAESIRDIPQALTSIRDTATTMSFIGLITAMVVILNGLCLRYIKD